MERKKCKIDLCPNLLDRRNVSGYCFKHYAHYPGPSGLKPSEGRPTELRSYGSMREREGEVSRSLEIQIQEQLFPRYRAWILTCLLKGSLTVKEAIYGGSMFLKRTWGHGSADTTREWLNELCSKEGEFETFDPPYENLGPCVRQRTPELLKELEKSGR